MKVQDLDVSTKFYENVFGFKLGKDTERDGHISRHMSDGSTDIALMKYASEDVPEAMLSGAGPGIHHWGMEVPDVHAAARQIEAAGGQILSKPDAKALKFRGPDGNIAEIVPHRRLRRLYLIRSQSRVATERARPWIATPPRSG